PTRICRPACRRSSRLCSRWRCPPGSAQSTKGGIEPSGGRAYPYWIQEKRPMSVPSPGAIDCDIHPALPSMQALVPYLDEYWRSHILMRGLERDNYTAAAFPPNAPINCRPDWKPAKGSPGTDIDLLRAQTLDAFGSRHAICNVLHGAPAVFSEDLSAAMCRAINDWLAAEWLAKDDRLRASIVVPMHSPELAAKEV